MRIVVQRVSRASVNIDNQIKSSIGEGLLILLGIMDEDTEEDIDFLIKKTINLRIFDDENGIMNRSISELKEENRGEILCVSQFTLYASTKKGNRPSYIKASKPDFAIPMYEKFCNELSIAFGKPIQTGQFGADMKVELINNGPVTIIIDSKTKE